MVHVSENDSRGDDEMRGGSRCMYHYEPVIVPSSDDVIHPLFQARYVSTLLPPAFHSGADSPTLLFHDVFSPQTIHISFAKIPVIHPTCVVSGCCEGFN